MTTTQRGLAGMIASELSIESGQVGVVHRAPRAAFFRWNICGLFYTFTGTETLIDAKRFRDVTGIMPRNPERWRALAKRAIASGESL